MKKLDVMVLESHAHAARLSIEALHAAGHEVHRCHDPRNPGFPCRGITEEDACPLDSGVDVALLVRRGVAPRPTHLEQGASCAIRAGVPLVEDGPTVLDPFEPWITRRVTGEVTDACEEAAGEGFRPLRQAIVNRIGGLLAAARLEPTDLTCRFERRGQNLHVILSGPEVTRRFEQALAVRVHDAIVAGRRRFGKVDVSYRPV